MELKNIKTALFGFNKKNVCEYIAQLNEELDAKLKSEKEELDKRLEEKDEIISSLERSIEKMNAENLEIRKNNDEIADILLDAKKFAKTLREKAIAENDEMCRKNRERNQEIQSKLTQYRNDVGKIHEQIVKMLQNMDDSLSSKESELSVSQEKFDITDDE